jgi:uncharacterized YccA/Bax inhibitor family protein
MASLKWLACCSRRARRFCEKGGVSMEVFLLAAVASFFLCLVSVKLRRKGLLIGGVLVLLAVCTLYNLFASGLLH